MQQLLPFASQPRMCTIGQEQSVTVNESGRSTLEVTGAGARSAGGTKAALPIRLTGVIGLILQFMLSARTA